MSTRTAIIVTAVIILAAVAVSAYAYPLLPARIASHWGADGQANGTMGKFWGLFLLPLIMLLCAALFFVLPKVDPLKENIALFRKYYDAFIILLMLFFLYLHGATVAWNLGYRFNFSRILAPAFGVLWLSLGIMLPHLKRNWFIGIRTPWTLSSDRVWNATHRLGSTLFKVSGAAALAGIFFADISIWLMLVPIIVSAIVPVIYSYVLYRNEHRPTGA